MALLQRLSMRASAGGLRAFSSAAPALTFKASDLKITKTTTPKPKPNKETLTFGATFTDHMLEIDWTEKDGWKNPVIRPYEDLKISPASTCLHYGEFHEKLLLVVGRFYFNERSTNRCKIHFIMCCFAVRFVHPLSPFLSGIQCFEGMKCYNSAPSSPTPTSLRLFRPDCNMARLNSSMDRLNMPTFDSPELISLISTLVRLEKDWVPQGDGYSLYLRPTAIGTHPFLGVDVSKSVKLYVICSPVGPYYRTGFAPVKLYCDSDNVRAWPGGTGGYKVGGNYGPTIKPAKAAMAKGYNQVLWMFGPDDEITECGAMNLFFVWVNEDGVKEIITPPLTRGDILPGVTRRSILHLAQGWGTHKISEEFVTMGRIAKASKEGRLLEAFGAGTAAVVSPIATIC